MFIFKKKKLKTARRRFKSLAEKMESKVVVSNFINGDFVSTDKYIDSFDPSTGEVWAKIPDSGENEVNEAVSAAKAAFPK